MNAATLTNAIDYAQKNPSLKAAQSNAKSYEKLYDASKSKEYYPSLDLSYNGLYLKDKPTVNFNLPVSLPGLGGAIQMQPQNQYSGAITLSYPLFTGFAIESQIEIAKLQAHKARLKTLDTKRNLSIGIVQAYSAAVSLKQLIDSQTLALNATQKSYTKAQAFYKLGMIAPAGLYKIESSLHSIQAQLIETKNRYETTLSQLSYLCHHHIDTVSHLPETTIIDFKTLQAQALAKRPDLKILQLIVDEHTNNIKLAKSQYYPYIGIFARAAYTGDTPELNGDGYTNKNKSALGFMINYNLFDGFATKNEIEAAKEARLASEFMLSSYKEQIISTLYQEYLTFLSYKEQLQAAKAGVKAAKSYENLVQAEFNNQISDADTLSRAISSLAMARAKLINTKAQMYLSYAKILLEIDNETFLNTLNKDEQ